MAALDIPKKMRAVVLSAHHADLRDAIGSLQVAEREVPRPGRGEVLVKIEAAPCNPSDLLLLQGRYGPQKSLPFVPGREGAGTVVATGGGLAASFFNGRRVACSLQADGDGTWAQYFLAQAGSCIPLKKNLRLQQAATLTINPLTAVGLIDVAQRDGHRAAVHTAGASQVGRMLLRVGEDKRFPIICVVRRREQVELLKGLGASQVLNSSDANFEAELTRVCRDLNATAAFEAVAGEMTGKIVGCLPPKSRVYLYGALSEEPCRAIEPVHVIFEQKAIEGFYLPHWVKSKNLLQMIRAASGVQQMMIDGRIETAVQRRLSFDEIVDGLLQYVGHMTEGKVLIMPHKT